MSVTIPYALTEAANAEITTAKYALKKVKPVAHSDPEVQSSTYCRNDIIMLRENLIEEKLDAMQH